MVMKRKKSKSKRVTLKQKHKVLRKVKEHHKKKAKEANKVVLSRKRKVEKDPGVPNELPYKEKEFKAPESRRARAVEELEAKKADRRERVQTQKRKFGLLEDDDTSTDMVSLKERKFGAGSVSDKTRDSSDRAFYKELVKVIEASDVILEVLDARDPLGTRCVDMEKMVIRSGPEKHLVLLLNKIDLVPREAAEKWLKYLREELPAVAFKCSTQEQKSNLGWKSSRASKTSNLLQTSDCLGAETLIKLLKNYSRSHDIKRSITVGVIGLPNVGKSSLINSLKRSHVVNVGATPGLTRALQEVQLDKNVKLLDCPGVVMLKSGENDASIALRNCKRIEKLDDPIAPVKEILKLCETKMLESLYKIPSFDSVDEFLQTVATVRGKLKKGGIVDVDAAARIVLHDWNEGKIPFYTMPPSRGEGEPSEEKIVSEFGKEFNVDEVYGTESSFIGSLKSVNDFQSVEVTPNRPVNFDERMLLEDDGQTQTTAQATNSAEVKSNFGDDASMGCEEDDAGGEKKAKSIAVRQNEKLYIAEGMLNTKLRRADKKRRKKSKAFMKAGDVAMEDDCLDKDSTMEDSVDHQIRNKNKFEIPSGFDLDNQ